MLACATAAPAQPSDLLWGKPGGLFRQVMAFSPDAAELAYGCAGGIRFADAGTGELRGVVRMRDPVAVAYAPGGGLIACAERFGPVLLIDADSREVLQTISADAAIPRIAFVSDSLLLLGTKGPARLWSITSQRVVRSFGGTNISDLALSPDRGSIAWQDTGGITVAAVDGGIIATLDGLLPADFTFAPDGHSLLALHREGGASRLRMYRIYGGWVTGAFTLEASGAEVADPLPDPIRLSPDGRLVAVTLGGDSSAWFWRLSDGEPEKILYFNTAINALEFSPDGRYLTVGGAGLQAHQLDARSWNYIRDLDLGHSSIVRAVDYSPDDRWIATTGEDGRVRLWDARNGIPGRILLGAQSDVTDLEFSPDGLYLAGTERGAGDTPPAILLWDLVTGKIVQRIVTGLPPGGYSIGPAAVVTFTPDGGSVLTGGGMVPLRRWNLATGELTGVFGDSSDIALAVAVSPDGKTAAVASNGFSPLVLWDLASGELLMGLKEVIDPESVAFTPDGGTLVAGDGAGGIWIVDRASAKIRHIRAEETDGYPGTDIAISRDGRSVFATGGSETVRVYDLESGDLTYRYRTPIPHGPGGDWWFRVALANGGASLATVGIGGSVAVWRVDGVIAGVEGDGGTGGDDRLRVWPNPASGGDVRIGFDLPASAVAGLRVHNALGEEIAVIAQSKLEQGVHEYRWNADGVAPGVYFIRLEAGGISRTIPVVVRGR